MINYNKRIRNRVYRYGTSISICVTDVQFAVAINFILTQSFYYSNLVRKNSKAVDYIYIYIYIYVFSSEEK